MKPFYQIIAAMMLLLFFGVSEAECLVQNAQMSDAEKACCRQMAGQCDMNMAAKHPCCQKIVQRHDDVDLNDLSNIASPSLATQAAITGADVSVAPSVSLFDLLDPLGKPPHTPPIPSIEILRI